MFVSSLKAPSRVVTTVILDVQRGIDWRIYLVLPLRIADVNLERHTQTLPGSMRMRRNYTFLRLARRARHGDDLFAGRKVQKLPASFSSSELSTHQMAPSGVIAH